MLIKVVDTEWRGLKLKILLWWIVWPRWQWRVLRETYFAIPIKLLRWNWALGIWKYISLNYKTRMQNMNCEWKSTSGAVKEQRRLRTWPCDIIQFSVENWFCKFLDKTSKTIIFHRVARDGPGASVLFRWASALYLFGILEYWN